MDHFETCSGLGLNKSKTEIMWIGSTKENKIKPCGIKYKTEPIKTLGVWVGTDMTKIQNQNIEERLTKLKTILNMWKQRDLTLKGKVMIINTLALSQLQYIVSSLHIPENTIEEVNKLIFDFLWPKKVFVKKSTIISEYSNGGLRMPDFETKVKATKVMWVKHLLTTRGQMYKIANELFLDIPLIYTVNIQTTKRMWQ